MYHEMSVLDSDLNPDRTSPTIDTTSILRSNNLEELLAPSTERVLIVGGTLEEVFSLWLLRQRQGLPSIEYVCMNISPIEEQIFNQGIVVGAYSSKISESDWKTITSAGGIPVSNKFSQRNTRDKFMEQILNESLKIAAEPSEETFVIKFDDPSKVFNARFITCDALDATCYERLGIFDSVFSNNLFMHLSNEGKDQVIKNIAGVVKKSKESIVMIENPGQIRQAMKHRSDYISWCKQSDFIDHNLIGDPGMHDQLKGKNDLLRLVLLNAS